MTQTIVAHLRYVRIAPRKVRLVADLMRGKKVEKAKVLLMALPKGATHCLEKLLSSAVATASHNYNIDESNLLISRITVGEGPKLKRFMPRMKGSASPIHKKTSHVLLELKEIDPGKKGVIKSIKQEKETKEVKETKKPKHASVARPEKTTEKARAGVKQKVFRRKAI